MSTRPLIPEVLLQAFCVLRRDVANDAAACLLASSASADPPGHFSGAARRVNRAGERLTIVVPPGRLSLVPTSGLLNLGSAALGIAAPSASDGITPLLHPHSQHRIALVAAIIHRYPQTLPLSISPTLLLSSPQPYDMRARPVHCFA